MPTAVHAGRSTRKTLGLRWAHPTILHVAVLSVMKPQAPRLRVQLDPGLQGVVPEFELHSKFW